MDEKLIQKVCFYYGCMAGYLMWHHPEDYKFEFADLFTDEELKLINEVGRESDEYKESMEAALSIVKELIETLEGGSDDEGDEQED